MQDNKRTINIVFWIFVVLCGVVAQVSILAGTDSGVVGAVTLIVIGFAWLARNLAVGAHRAPQQSPSPGTYCMDCRHQACIAARTAAHQAALDEQDPEMARLGHPEFISDADVRRAQQGDHRRPGRR